MKSKTALETLRQQLTSSLDTFSKYSSSEDVSIIYTFEETDKLNLKVPVEGKEDKIVNAYGLVLQAHQKFSGEQETKTRKLWLRRYPITGSLNEVKYQAFKELFDVMIGNFIINANRTDDKTLEELSNKKHTED